MQNVFKFTDTHTHTNQSLTHCFFKRLFLTSGLAFFFLLSFNHQRAVAQENFYCGTQYTEAWDNVVISNVVFGSGLPPAGSVIVVSGTLTIDVSVTFQNFDFIMKPGATINVKNSNIFPGVSTVMTANGSRFFACRTIPSPKMWNGINVSNGASIVFDQVTLSDAWVGISFLSSADRTNSAINNSYVQLSVYGIFIGSSLPFTLASFNGNTIRATNGAAITTLLPPPPGRVYSYLSPGRGIWLANANATLGIGATSTNIIEGFRNGIALYGSVFTVDHVTVRGGQDEPAALPNGCDVYNESSTLLVMSGCVFQNAPRNSIYCVQARGVTVTGADFTNPGHTAIRCVQSRPNTTVHIVGNDLKMNAVNAVNGIYVERPGNTGSGVGVNIEDNLITRTGTYKYGLIFIEVNGLQAATDEAKIFNNRIKLTGGSVLLEYVALYTGIAIRGMGRFYTVGNSDPLLANTIEYVMSGPAVLRGSVGILATDLTDPDNTIIGNTISANLGGSASFVHAGIRLQNCPNSLFVCDNVIDNTHKDIECLGALNQTLLKTNKLGPAGYGLFCASGTTMPDQVNFENKWTAATYGTIGALYDGVPPFRIFYDPNVPQTFPANNSWSPSTWFEQQPGSDPYCGFGTGANLMQLNAPEQEIAGGAAIEAKNATDWDNRRDLLDRLSDNAEILTGNQAAAAFLKKQSDENTSAWQFARAFGRFESAFSATTSPALEQLSAEMRDLSAQMAASGGNTATGLALRYAEAAGQWAQLYEKEVLPARQTALQSVLKDISTLPGNHIYESNMKAVLAIAARYAMGDSLTAADYGILRDIAGQCPASGGRWVRLAPMWLPDGESQPYLYKDWASLCGTEARGHRARYFAATMTVTPNPANDRADILLPTGITGTWNLRDIAGRTVQEGQIAGVSVLSIDLTRQKAGVYLLSISDQSGDLSGTVKVIVQR